MRETRPIPRIALRARLNRYIGAYLVCHLASYDACALIPFKLFIGFRTLWALELAGAGYPLWLWAVSPFAWRWGPPAATFCKKKTCEDCIGQCASAVFRSIGFLFQFGPIDDLDLTKNLCDREHTSFMSSYTNIFAVKQRQARSKQHYLYFSINLYKNTRFFFFNNILSNN